VVPTATRSQREDEPADAEVEAEAPADEETEAPAAPDGAEAQGPELAPEDRQRGGRARSWGSGRVEITGLRVCNAVGLETTRFLGSAPMRVEVDYVFRDPEAPDPKFTVRVHALDGDVLFGANSVIDNFDRAVPRPAGRVAMIIPDLPLREGRFLLSAGLSTKRETEVFHLLERWIEFSVFAPRPGEGTVAIAREWALVSDEVELEVVSPLS
jgi:hypothetical protein